LRKEFVVSNEPIYRLFILGAGFSKPAGLPIGSELLDKVRKRVRSQFQQFGWDGPLEREIEEWRKLYPRKPITIESVLAYSHRKHFLGLIGSDEYFAHGSRSIVATKNVIQEVLTTSTPITPPPLYIEFANNLTPRDTVLTFNYDTLLEDTLDAIGKPYSLTPEWWLSEDVRNSGAQEYSPQYVDIIKLHGSVDWYDRNYHDESCRYYNEQGQDVPDQDPIFGLQPSIQIESLARGKVEKGFGNYLLARVFRVTNHRKHLHSLVNSYDVVPFLLPPAYDKILGHDPIRDLWQNMHRTLDAYSAIVVIGYSMPPYDAYAYEALGHLIASYQAGGAKTYFGHRRTPVQIVALSQSEKEVLKSIPFLHRRQTKIWHKGFDFDSLNWLDWGD
jgi:hypothetical protein